MGAYRRLEHLVVCQKLCALHYRELQIKPHDEMRIEFKAAAAWQTKWGYPLLAALGFAFGFGLLARLAFGPRR